MTMAFAINYAPFRRPDYSESSLLEKPEGYQSKELEEYKRPVVQHLNILDILPMDLINLVTVYALISPSELKFGSFRFCRAFEVINMLTFAQVNPRTNFVHLEGHEVAIIVLGKTADNRAQRIRVESRYYQERAGQTYVGSNGAVMTEDEFANQPQQKNNCTVM